MRIFRAIGLAITIITLKLLMSDVFLHFEHALTAFFESSEVIIRALPGENFNSTANVFGSGQTQNSSSSEQSDERPVAYPYTDIPQ